jgi:O-antigen/teichoic acid export membrane protein
MSGSSAHEAIQPTPRAPESGFSMTGVGKHAVVYGLGTLAGKAISFLMLPVYTRYLTPADYGIMGLIEMTLDVISILAGAQIALGVFRYYHKARTADEADAVVSTAFIALSVSYALVGSCCAIAAPWLSALLFGETTHTDLIRIASARVGLQSLVIVPFTYLRMKDRSTLFVAANLASLFIGLTLNIVLVVFLGIGVLGVFLSGLTATLVVGVVLSGWVLTRVGLRFSRSATRDLLRFGIPMIGMQFATFVMTFGDRYFLQAFGGEEVVGRYHLAYMFGFILAMVGYMPFEQVWAPKRFEVVGRADRDAVFANGFLYSTCWLVTIAVGMALFIDDVFRVMTQPGFYSAASVVPIILAAYVLQGWAGIHDIGILVREQTGYLTVANWIAAAVALAAYAVLIPSYLGLGAAIGTLCSFFTRWSLTYYYSQRLWPVRYRWRPVLRLASIAVGVVLVGMVLPELPIVPSIALHSMLFAAYCWAFWHGGILTAEEKARAVQLGRRACSTAVAGWRSRRTVP